MDLPDLLKLPAGLQSSGDPVRKNPFPNEDPRHKVWEDATHDAEEELHRFNSGHLKTRPDPSDLGVSWMCDLVVGKFDIWAKRGVQVLWSDDAVRTYDKWLLNYAQSWLRKIRAFFPTSIPIETLLRELRLRLIARVEWWKGEARKYVAPQRHGLATTRVPSGPEPKATRWQEIEVIFLSDERVQIEIGAHTETRNYAEMGFANKQNGKPRLAWGTLRYLARVERSAQDSPGPQPRVDQGRETY
jgi:hypothetical protein